MSMFTTKTAIIIFMQQYPFYRYRLYTQMLWFNNPVINL
jgi:hypothetical protein